MTRHSWRAGRIAGIAIRIDSSWAVIAALVTYSLYLEFSLTYRSLSEAAAGLLGVAAAAFFFGSVLTHELVHALTARHRGMEVSGITLFLFGGATHADVEAKSPRDEFIVSIVGPLSSMMLGVGFAVVAAALGQVHTDPIAGALGYLAWVNMMLAGFNLLPGLPLDGGRVLRSIVWRVTGSLRRATKVASFSGELMGYMMIAGGLFLLFSDALAAGLWFAAIGWFLSQSARASYADLEARGLLRGLEAEDVMDRDVISLSPELTVHQAVEEFLQHPDQDAFLVRGGEQLLGVVTLAVLRRVPRDQWDIRTVRDKIKAIQPGSTVMRHAPIEKVLSILQSGETGCILVVDRESVIGLITGVDVVNSIKRRKLVAA